MNEIASLSPNIHIAIALVFGLLVGSFLNVVIYRFPVQLKYQWTSQSYEWLNGKPYTEKPAPDGLLFPASRCGNCQSPIKAWQNIPVISYLILRGKCSNCQHKISLRYPLVELLTGIASAVVMSHFGWGLQALCAIILTWALIALTFIDFDHQLLPDDIVLPMLWFGLALNLVPLFSSLQDAVIGAIAGYLSLWSVFQLFKILTGKEGMGHGDFKLLALFGAWLGWQFLPQIILVSTLLGSIVGVLLMITKKMKSETAIPFGPYIALAGWIALLWGQNINDWYFKFSGLS